MKLRSTLLFAAASLTASALAPVAFPPSAYGAGETISINFVSESGAMGDNWNDTTGASGTVNGLKDSTGTTLEDLTLTYSSNNTWGHSTGISDEFNVLKGYLDDKDRVVTIGVSGISYLTYDVTVLAATDTEGAKFSAKTINGITYYGDGSGVGIVGSDLWGASHETEINGNNSFTVSGLAGDLSVSSVRNDTGGSYGRGCIAGLIITNTYDGTAISAEISGDGASWTDTTLGDEVWTNSTAEAGTYAALTLTADTTLNVTGTAITTDAITAKGSGAVTLSGNAVSLIGPAGIRAVSDSASIVIDNVLNFNNGGFIQGNVSFGENALLNVSAGVLAMSASTVGGIISVSKDASLRIESPAAENEVVNDLTAVVGTGTIVFASRGSTSDSGDSDGSFSRVQLSGDFTGTLSLVSGVLDLLEGDGSSAVKESYLGGVTTIELNGGGILFRNNDGGSFTKDIVVGERGGVVRLYGNGNVSVTGDIFGIGTLTHTDGGTLTFKGSVENDGFRQVRGTTNFSGVANIDSYTQTGGTTNFSGVANINSYTQTGGTANFNGSTNLEKINFISGAIKFSNTGEYNVKSIETNNGSNRALTIDSGTTVSTQALNNAWGLETLTVNGTLFIDGEMKYTSGNTTNTVLGEGEIFVQKLNLGNTGTYNVSGVTLNIGSGGIVATNEWGHKTNFGALIIKATSDFSVAAFRNGTLSLSDADTGTTFDTDGYNVDVQQALSGAGKLVKSGEGMLTLSAGNTYAGGTTIKAGTLVAANTSALSTGDVVVEAGTLLREVADTLAIGGNLTVSAGAILDLGELSSDKSAISVGGNVSLAEGVIFNIASQTAGKLLSSTGTLSGITAEQVEATLYIDGVLVNQRAVSATISGNEIAVSFSEASALNLTWNGGEEGVWKGNGAGWKNGEDDEKFQNGDSVAFNNTAVVEVDGIVASGVVTVDGNSTLTLNSGTVVVSEAFTLEEGASLAGTAKIDLGSTGTFSGTLSDEWTGKIRISNRDLHEASTGGFVFGNYGNENSQVEISGISGYINDAWNGTATERTFTVSTNIIFADTEDGSPAFKQTNNNSNSTIYFTGKISGSGTYENAISTQANNVTYAFTGDISGWTGAFKQTTNKTTTLKFTDQYGAINIDIFCDSGVLMFATDVSETLTIASGKLHVGASFGVSSGTLDLVIPESETWIYEGGNITGDGRLKISGGGVFSWNVNSEREISANLEISEGTTLTESVLYKYHRTISGNLFGGGTIYSAVPTSENQGDNFKRMLFSGNTANFTGEWILETAASSADGNRRILGILNSADGIFGGVINFTSKEGSTPDASKKSSYLSLSKDMTIGGLKGTLGTVKGAVVDGNTGEDAENGAHSLTINLATDANYDFGGELASTITELTITGNGTQILSGVNSHGKTTISGGTLKATQDAALSSGPITIDENGTLELAFGGSFSRTLGGTGTLAKSGTEDLEFTGTVAFSGSFDVKEGLLSVNAENGSYKDLSVAAGATFKASQNVVFETVNAAGTLSGASKDTRISVGSGVFSGTLDKAALEKTGTGTLDLAGMTAVNGGSIVVSGTGAISNLSVTKDLDVTISDSLTGTVTFSDFVFDGGAIVFEKVLSASEAFVLINGNTASGDVYFSFAGLTVNQAYQVFTFDTAQEAAAWNISSNLGDFGVFSWSNDGKTLLVTQTGTGGKYIWAAGSTEWNSDSWIATDDNWTPVTTTPVGFQPISDIRFTDASLEGGVANVTIDTTGKFSSNSIVIDVGDGGTVSFVPSGDYSGSLASSEGITVKSGTLVWTLADGFYRNGLAVDDAGTLKTISSLTISNDLSGSGTILHAPEAAETLTLSGNRSQFTGTLDVEAGTVVLANGTGTEAFSRINIAEGATVSATSGAAVSGFNTLTLGMVSGTGTLVANSQGSGFYALDLSGSDFEGVVELNGADAVLARNPNEAHVTSVSNFANAKAVRLTNGAALTFFNEAIAFDTDIEVAASGGAIRVYGNNTGATIAGAVSGTETLTVKDGGAVKFTGGMELGTLSVASASSVEISGDDANLGALVSSSASTALIVGGNVSVAGDFTASGFGSITLTESGRFTTTGNFTSTPGDGKTMSVVGAGASSLITAQELDVGGSGTTSFESVRIDVANGIVVGSDLLLKDVVLGVAEGSDGWSTSMLGMKLNGGSTTFDVAAGKEITVTDPLTEAVAQSGTEGEDGYVAGTSSELIKIGAGTLVFEAVNAHKGGTTINEGVLKFTNTNGIDLGDTAYAFNGGALAAGASTTVSVGAGTAFSGNVILTSDRNGKFLFTEDFSYTEGFTLDAGAAVEIADGKTLTLSSLAFTNAGSTVSGDGTLALAGTLTAANNHENTISSNFMLAADSTINVVSGTVVLSGEDVSAKGFALTKTGAGTLKFASKAVYDFEGSFLIQGGTVDLDGRNLTIANGSVFGLHGAVLKGNLVLDGGTAELGGGTSKIDGNVSIENTSLTFGGKVTGIGELTWGDGNTISLTDAFRATLSGTGTLLDFDSAKDANGNALSADTDFGDIIDGSAFLGRDVELVYNADNTTLDIAVTGALQWNTGVAYWIQTATMSEIELPKWDLVTKTGVVEKSEIFTAGKFVEFNRAGSVTLVGRATGYMTQNGAVTAIYGSGTINTAGIIFNIADGGSFTLNAAQNGAGSSWVSLAGVEQTDAETGTKTNVDDGITILAGNIVIAKDIDNRLTGGMRIFGGSLTVSDEKALGDGTVTLGDASSASSATLTFNETTEVGQTVYVGNTAAIIGVNNEKTVTVEKALEKDASATAAALTKQGAGTLVIQRETALDGITVSGGTLRLAGEGDSDLGTAAFTVGSGATLEVENGSGTGANTSFESLALNGALKVGGGYGAFRAGTISSTGAGSVSGILYVGGETSFTDGENNTYAGTALSVDANATLSIGTVKSYGNTGAALYKIGAGTLTLGGNIEADFVHDAGTVVFAETLRTEKNYTVSGSGKIQVNSGKTATFAGGFTSEGVATVTLNKGASATFNGFSASDGAVTVFSSTDNKGSSVSITGGTENPVALGTVYVGGSSFHTGSPASGLISLSVEADNVSAETIALGAGSSLTLKAGGATAKSLYIENWNGLVSTLDLSSGTKLELKNEGDTPSEIQGTGTLKVVGGTLSVTGWSGGTTASPNIILDGATFNVEVDDLSSCSLSALSTTEKGGTFSKSGAGTLSLREGQGADPTKDMEFDGTVAVNEGDLRVYATMSNADVSVGENGTLSVVANVELGDDMVNVNTLAKKLSGAGTLVARGALYANGGLDDFNGKLVVSGPTAALYVSSATETWLGGDVKTRGIGMKNSGTVASLSDAVNLKEVSLDGSGRLFGVLDDADVVSLTVGSVVAASNSSLTLGGAGTLGALSFASAEDGASATNTLTAETGSMWTINGGSENLSQVTLNAGSVLVVENNSALGDASVSVGENGCLKITADGEYANAIELSDGIVWATGEVELKGDLTADSAATFVAGEEGTAGTLTLSESALSLNSATFTAATADSKIVISNENAKTLTATLGGAGTFEKTGAGTLTADSTLGSVGTFSVAEGSVVFGSEAQLSAHGDTTGTLAVATDASATINGTDLAEFDLGGDGSVTVSGGTGKLNGMKDATNVSLSGNAALSVVGNVSGSVVAFEDGATLKTTGEDSQIISYTTLSGATVTLSNENASAEVIYDSTVELDGTTTLVLDARTGFNGGEFAGVYSGSLEKTGDGKWIVSNYTYGANADEELNVAGGTLEWQNANIGNNAGEISLGTNATLRVFGLASGDTLHGTLSGDDSTTLEIADTTLTLETAAKEGSNWGVKISGTSSVTVGKALPGSLEVAGTAKAILDLDTDEMEMAEGDQLIVSKSAELELSSGTLTVGNTSDKMMNTIDGSVSVGEGSTFNQTAGIRWADGSNLTIDGTYAVSYGTDFGNTGWNRATITGTGTLFVMNTAESGYSIGGKVSEFGGTLKIADGAKVNLTGGASFDNAAAIILNGENAVLEVAHNLGGTLNHLSGEGEVVINGDSSANNFLTAHYKWGEENNHFTGSVSVRSGALDLSADELFENLAVGGDKPARYSESAKAAGISQGAWLRLMTDESQGDINIGDLDLGFLKDNGGVIFSGGTYAAGKTFGSDTNQGNLYVVEKDATLALASGADVNGGLFVAYGSTLELGKVPADATALNTNGIGATNNTVYGDFTLNGKLVVEVSDENVDDPLLAVNGTTKIATGGQGVAEIVIDTSGTTEDLSTRDITIVSGYKDTAQNLDDIVSVTVMGREVEVSRDGNGNIVVVSAVNDYTAPSGLQGIYDAIRAAGSSSLWTYLKSDRANSDSLNDKLVALSPVSYGSLAEMQHGFAALENELLRERLEQRRYERAFVSDSAKQFKPFVNVIGSQREGDGDGTASANYDISHVGLIGGFDVAVSRNTIFGVSLGFDRSEADLHAGLGKNKGNGTRLGVYGMSVFDNAYFGYGASAGAMSFETKRNSGYNGETLKGETDGNDLNASFVFGAGWTLDQSLGIDLAPYVGLDFGYAYAKAFKEEGGRQTALSVDKTEHLSLRGTIGATLGWRASDNLRISLDASFSHEFLDSDTDIDATFASGELAGTAFSSTAYLTDENTIRVGPRVDYRIDDTWSVSGGYSYETDLDDTVTHSANVGFRARF